MRLPYAPVPLLLLAGLIIFLITFATGATTWSTSRTTRTSTCWAIKRVPGANQASLFGASDNAMRVWLRPDSMASRGITTTDIQTAIAKQNQQFGAGAIGQSPTSQPVEVTIPVVTEGRFNQPEQFENVILRTDQEGAAIVRLGDVGRAEEGLQNYMMRPSLNGKPAVFISVYQQPGSNALAVAEGVRRTLAGLETGFPDGIAYEISLDTTKFVTASIEEVVHTLIEAVVLVVRVVYVFLQNLRATLIPTLAVVVSIVGTFVGMTLLGFSVNLAMEKTHEGVKHGSVTLKKNANRLKEFVEQDKQFHGKLEDLARASHKNDSSAMLSLTKDLLDRCVKCHRDFR